MGESEVDGGEVLLVEIEVVQLISSYCHRRGRGKRGKRGERGERGDRGDRGERGEGRGEGRGNYRIDTL